MVVPDGATMAHVDWASFWPLVGLVAIIPASKAFRVARMFLSRF